MECEYYEKYGMLYLSGELSESRKIEYSAHLQKCADCRHNLEIEQKIYDALHFSNSAPSAALDNQILAAVSKINSEKKRNKSIPLIRHIRSFSLLAVAVISFLIIIQFQPEEIGKSVDSFAWDDDIGKYLELNSLTEQNFDLLNNEENYASNDAEYSSDYSENEYNDNLYDFDDEAGQLLETLDLLEML